MNIKLHDRGRDWLDDIDIYGSRSGEFHSGLVEMAGAWLEDDPEYLFGYLLRGFVWYSACSRPYLPSHLSRHSDVNGKRQDERVVGKMNLAVSSLFASPKFVVAENLGFGAPA